MLQTKLLAIQRLTDFFNLLYNEDRVILIETPYFENRIRLILQEIEMTPISRFPESYRKILANAISMFSVIASNHGPELERIHKTLMHLYWWDGIDQRESGKEMIYTKDISIINFLPKLAWACLCIELFNYLTYAFSKAPDYRQFIQFANRSEAVHVRLSAIEKLTLFFADWRMIGWFLASDFANSQQCFLALNFTINELTYLEMSDHHKRMLDFAQSQFSNFKISIHVAGVSLISPRNDRLFLSDRRLRRVSRQTSTLSPKQEFLWEKSFHHLLSGIRYDTH